MSDPEISNRGNIDDATLLQMLDVPESSIWTAMRIWWAYLDIMELVPWHIMSVEEITMLHIFMVSYAPSSEYMEKVLSFYDDFLHQVEGGGYSDEFNNSMKTRLRTSKQDFTVAFNKYSEKARPIIQLGEDAVEIMKQRNEVLLSSSF